MLANKPTECLSQPLVENLTEILAEINRRGTTTLLVEQMPEVALALLGFNLGVEAGQALVVALLLPLLLSVSSSVWEPRIVRAASLAVAAVGCAWLVRRLFPGWS